MAKGRLSMRKIREILRLKYEGGHSNQVIAKSIGVSSSTVSETLKRAKDAGITAPLADDFDEAALIEQLYRKHGDRINTKDRGDIDWVYVHNELKRKHVTLMLLWQEYKEKNPKGVLYSQFCHAYRKWRGHLDVWMRQPHKAGEKCFVDYSGMTMPVVDRSIGEVRHAEIFVASLGASSFTFAEATWTQSLPDWIASHTRAFTFFGGVPEIIVPDNLKSGVQKAHRYEPDLNPTYQDMACHYGVAIIPTRVATPKDKPKVENAVLQIERQILAKLRDKTFFSLQELNDAIRPLLNELNNRPFQKLPGSRQSQFETLEKPALKPLPSDAYAFAQWKNARAGADYHVEVDNHFYSVPYTFTKKELQVRHTQKTVEVFYKSQRIASHIRSYAKYKHTTTLEHMPKKHQVYAEWTPERIIRWAEKTGAATALIVEQIMQSRQHPQQGFRSCFGLLRLGKTYTTQRLEAACTRAIEIGAHSYKSIESILKNGLDQQPLSNTSHTSRKTHIPSEHEYVRGQSYFN